MTKPLPLEFCPEGGRGQQDPNSCLVTIENGELERGKMNEGAQAVTKLWEGQQEQVKL